MSKSKLITKLNGIPTCNTALLLAMMLSVGGGWDAEPYWTGDTLTECVLDTCQKMLDNNLKTYAAFECVSQTDCMELVALMAYRAS